MNIVLKIIILIVTISTIASCSKEDNEQVMTFAISANYPPFEYVQRQEYVGFDIDLAKEIAKRMGKRAEFIDLQFILLLPALDSYYADMAISTLSVTAKRSENFDFSRAYYLEGISILYLKELQDKSLDLMEIAQDRIGVQLGSILEGWIIEKRGSGNYLALDDVILLLESLKNHMIDLLLLDEIQAQEFARKYPELVEAKLLEKSERGYAIAFRKNSSLKTQVDSILLDMEQDGSLEQLKRKWLGIEMKDKYDHR